MKLSIFDILTVSLQIEIMTTTRPPNMLGDKQTIVTNLAFTTARGLDVFLKKKMPEWTKDREYVKTLFVCGSHGNPNGTIGKKAEAADLRSLRVRYE